MIRIDRQAPVIVREEIHIAAPPSMVWHLHTDINDWPRWRYDVTSAHLDGPFEAGAVFHWQSGDLSIDSTIGSVEPYHRTVWGGPAAGIEGVHVWTFVPESAGTHVITEESWSGRPVDDDPEKAHIALAGSLRVWLRALDKAARPRS